MRLFVGLELPPRLRVEIAALQARLRAAEPGGGRRWVDVSAMHLTLVFLGEVAAARVDGVAAAISGPVEGAVAPCLGLGGLGTFPGVDWVGVVELGERLVPLQRGIESALVALGWPAAARAFQPHVTLARGPGAGRFVVPVTPGGVEPLPAPWVGLFRSHQRPAGPPRYEVLRRWPLRSPEER